jgi:hypothetical protein
MINCAEKLILLFVTYIDSFEAHVHNVYLWYVVACNACHYFEFLASILLLEGGAG